MIRFSSINNEKNLHVRLFFETQEMMIVLFWGAFHETKKIIMAGT